MSEGVPNRPRSEAPWDKDIHALEQIRGAAFKPEEKPAHPDTILNVHQILEQKGGMETLAQRGLEEVAETINEHNRLTGKALRPMTVDEVKDIYEKYLKKVA